MSDKTTTPERKYDTHEKRRELAALRYKGDRNAINDRVHVTLTKMNLRNGYSDALEKHAAPQEVRIQELEDQVKALRKAAPSTVPLSPEMVERVMEVVKSDTIPYILEKTWPDELPELWDRLRTRLLGIR